MGSLPRHDTGETYDYVICGQGCLRLYNLQRADDLSSGGTAGCVVAARLAEDPSVSVLLVEAGKLNSDVPASSIPGGCVDPFV